MLKRLRKARQRMKDAQAWRRVNQRNREWLLQHPMRVADHDLRRAAINFTEVSEAEMAREMENARLAGRTSLRTRLKELVAAIVSQTRGAVKEEA